MEFLQVIGGVALILFGIRFLRKGLDRLFGHSLVGWLQKLTHRRWQAFLGGIMVSAIAPSSTTQSLLTLQLLREGRLRAVQALAVLLGVNVGLTITVQLLAFQIYSYFAVFLVVGLIGFQFLSREVFRGIGQVLLALGFIFLAMNLISAAAREASQYDDLRVMLEIFANHPFILVVAATLLTLLLQSSTASIGMALGLVQGGLGGMEILVPVIIGANVGIGATALIAGWGNLEARRMGMGNLILKGGVGLGMVFFLGAITAWVGDWPGGAMRQGANFHTLFNLTVAAVGLPVLGLVARLVEFMLPDAPASPTTQRGPVSCLNEHSLSNPSIALVAASRETMRLVDELRNMLERFWDAFRNGADVESVRRMDDQMDGLSNEILAYLSRISEDSSTEEETRLEFVLVSFVNELETGGDLIEKGLCDHLVRYRDQKNRLSEAEVGALEKLYKTLQDRFDMAIGVLATRSEEMARRLVREKPAFDEAARDMQRRYFESWRSGNVQQAVEVWEFYFEMLNVFRRINSQLTGIAYGFIEKEK